MPWPERRCLCGDTSTRSTGAGRRRHCSASKAAATRPTIASESWSTRCVFFGCVRTRGFRSPKTTSSRRSGSARRTPSSRRIPHSRRGQMAALPTRPTPPTRPGSTVSAPPRTQISSCPPPTATSWSAPRVARVVRRSPSRKVARSSALPRRTRRRWPMRPPKCATASTRPRQACRWRASSRRRTRWSCAAPSRRRIVGCLDGRPKSATASRTERRSSAATSLPKTRIASSACSSA